MSSPSPWNAETAAALIAERRALPGALLPMLHALQEEFGYIDQAAVPLLADALNLSRAEIHGVITFYHDFRREPRGRHVVKVCRAESCQSMGADRLVAHAKGKLGIDFHHTTKDGRFTLEQVFCLGNCALSPAVMIDGELHGRVDEAGFDRLLQETGKPK